MPFLLDGRSPRGAVYIAVIGPGGTHASTEDLEMARRVGSLLAQRDAIVVCGGLEGVMAAACEGAAASGGLTVGLLPGRARSEGNQYLSVVLPTGLGELRNGLVVEACDAVIAVGGSWGTLSEISLAVRADKPVIMVAGWAIDGLSGQKEENLVRAASAEEAVETALVKVAATGKTRGLT